MSHKRTARKRILERLESRLLLAADVFTPSSVTVAPAASVPQQVEYRVSREDFELSIGNLAGSDSLFNFADDYDGVVFRATLEAGSATGAPPDTPEGRIDHNDTTGRFAGVGSVEIVRADDSKFICTGSVISSKHVLTAGHCFDFDEDGALDPDIVEGSSFHLNDAGSLSSPLGIVRVDVHPDYGGFATTGGNDDIAVVTLSSPVPMGTPRYAIRGTGLSLGEVITMVGYGESGQGDVEGNDETAGLRVKRSGQNSVELFLKDDDGSDADEVFIYDFDGAVDTGYLGGAPTLGNAVESVVRPGDSGGPAFVDVGDSIAIAGVNSFAFSFITSAPGVFGAIGGGQVIGPAQLRWISSLLAEEGEAVIPPASIADDIVGLSGSGEFWGGASDGSTLTTSHYGDWSPTTKYDHITPADLNGDGLDDLVALTDDGSLIVAISTPGSGFTTDTWGSLAVSTTWTELHIGDFNGDGLDDVLGRADIDGTLWLAASTGNSFVNSHWGKLSPTVTWLDMGVGDFNGDGRADLAARAAHDGRWSVAISTGTAFAISNWSQWSTAVEWSDASVGDFNGDGLDDIAGRANNGDWWINRSSGDNFFYVESWGSWSGTATWKDVLIGDFNGDGKDDIGGRTSGQWWIAVANDGKFLNEHWGELSSNTTWSNVSVLDINGDGLNDFLGRADNGEWWSSQSTGSGFSNILVASWLPSATWSDVFVGNFSNAEKLTRGEITA